MRTVLSSLMSARDALLDAGDLALLDSVQADALRVRHRPQKRPQRGSAQDSGSVGMGRHVAAPAPVLRRGMSSALPQPLWCFRPTRRSTDAALIPDISPSS